MLPVFPFRPNWRTPVVERLEWLTDVFEAHAGHESRQPLRHHPRRGLAYALALQGQFAAQLDALLWRNQSGKFALPLWTDPQPLSESLSSATTTIPAQTAGFDFHDGGQAVLWRGEGAHQLVTIDSVAPSALHLAAPLGQSWPAGSLLYPARSARLAPGVPVQRLTAGVLTSTLQWELDNTAHPALPDPVLYRGREVSLRRPNWLGGLAGSYQRKIQRLDYDTGAVAIDDLSGLPVTLRHLPFVLRDRAAIAAWRGWLHARAGRAHSYWQPQLQLDLTQAAAIAAGSTALHVRRLNYPALYAFDPGREDIALLHRSGQWLFRRITGATPAGSNEEILMLDQPLGLDAAPGDFTLITWLAPARLESDLVELTWHSAGVVSSSIGIRTVRA